MNERRSFFAAAIGALAGLFFQGAAEKPLPCFRLEKGRLVKVRMYELKAGDLFRHGDKRPANFKAGVDGRRLSDGLGAIEAFPLDENWNPPDWSDPRVEPCS
jgi:hypothetical protein